MSQNGNSGADNPYGQPPPAGGDRSGASSLLALCTFRSRMPRISAAKSSAEVKDRYTEANLR